ncbi:CopG family transcriptional regulator [Thermopolyspora sp. NPDC052614]|uniref:CopG family transcriptional regulator n=1 Tax=Thermopolyspora sp. NPDC052614 TaxID=3155682 RepID=UPI003435F02B
MTTKKYTVTLPEELAEAIRAEVGSGGFSRYVARALERQHERDRLHEFVGWWELEHGPVSDEDLAEAEAERRDLERRHIEQARTRGLLRDAG